MFSDFSPSHFSSCLTLSTSSLLFFLILHGHSFILSAGCLFFLLLQSIFVTVSKQFKYDCWQLVSITLH
uniref:Uncharacterized protein n=1 Tax=Anguilla anguilla TaxID=7936 RepID=A0A0E9WP66_ANGAN